MKAVLPAGMDDWPMTFLHDESLVFPESVPVRYINQAVDPPTEENGEMAIYTSYCYEGIANQPTQQQGLKPCVDELNFL